MLLPLQGEGYTNVYPQGAAPGYVQFGPAGRFLPDTNKLKTKMTTLFERSSLSIIFIFHSLPWEGQGESYFFVMMAWLPPLNEAKSLMS